MGGVMLGQRYRLGETIGRGGTSVVYRGHDEVLDRAVAVKMLAEIDDPRLCRLLRAEARAIGRLNHPRIAQVFDYGEAGVPVPYIVMELVDGEPLSQRLADRPVFAWPEAIAIAAQIAEALSAAHGRGLVHRDIKPDNVILTGNGVKLVDFGISAVVGSRDADDDGRLMGTPSYVAPERIADAPVGPAGDVYSLGVLLYRMLTGVLPWTVETRTQQLEAHAFVDPAPLPLIPGLPGEVADLYHACVAKDPHTRPTSTRVAAVLAGVASPEVAAAARVTSVDAAATRPLPVRTRALIRDSEPAADGSDGARRISGVLALGLGGVAVTILAVAWATGGIPAPGTAGDRVGCDAALIVERDTGHGFTAALRITNTGQTTLDGWILAFGFPGRQMIQPDPGTGDQATVTSAGGDAYTVTLTQSGPNVTASSDAGRTLSPGSTAILGLNARYQGINALPTTFDLNGHACRTRIAGATVTALTPSTVTKTPTTQPPAPGGPGKGKGKGHGKGKDG